MQLKTYIERLGGYLVSISKNYKSVLKGTNKINIKNIVL